MFWVPDPATISIHAPREGGDACVGNLQKSFKISIHAPREGGDKNNIRSVRFSDISIHAPREGGDDKRFYNTINYKRFQSTPPARGATVEGERNRL